MNPLVSLVILNWNGKKHITACLRSIGEISYKPIEVIVVDNNSTDGSQDYIRKTFPWILLIANKVNRGFSGGNNDGIAKSHGKYIFILNNDTLVTKNFLEQLVEAMEKDITIGCIQPKLIYASDHQLLNAVGSFFTSTGFLYHYGYRKNPTLPQYNRRLFMYSAKGAAMMIRAKALVEVGVFDEDFFIYFEETDLCHRLWLSGFSVVYEPTSVIYHAEAVDTHREFAEFRITYLSFRNRIASFVKTLEIGTLARLLPILLFIYLSLGLYYVLRGKWDQTRAIVLSIGWNIFQLPNTLKKRRIIQKKRQRSDADLFALIKKDPPLIYYYYVFTTLKNYRNEKPIEQTYSF